MTDQEALANDRVPLELVKCFPAFGGELQRSRASHGEGTALPYTDITALARYLVEARSSVSAEALTRLFHCIESLLVDGSTAERNLIVSGLFEDLQNVSMRAGIAVGYWERFLGPQSHDGWCAVIALWDGTISGREYNLRIAGIPNRTSDHGDD